MITFQVRNMMQKVQKDFYCSPQDATEFLSTLKSEPGMFCEYTLDAEGRLEDAYWATAEQQKKCVTYGGCIQLDTTVLVCRYGCLLLFVGVDSENRSCILGYSLLRSECTEIFEWILDKYCRASGGRRPKVVLSDADLAITAAVKTSWPSTLHLYCLWHIFKNMAKK
ncbi:unnamed protein product, partial [Sphacelaria rigidula]